MMLTRSTGCCCCYWTVLFILISISHGTPLAQKSEIKNTNTLRLKRQFDFDSPFIPFGNEDYNPNFFARPQTRRRPGPGEPLIFSNNGQQQTTATTRAPPPRSPNGQPNNNNNNNNNNNVGSNVVFVNNRPTVATIAPFVAPTTSSPRFLTCFGNCPTTSEYNPICASNQQQYMNEQKFECAIRCGADIQIVRRGSCAGLFPMQRG